MALRIARAGLFVFAVFVALWCALDVRAPAAAQAMPANACEYVREGYRWADADFDAANPGADHATFDAVNSRVSQQVAALRAHCGMGGLDPAIFTIHSINRGTGAWAASRHERRFSGVEGFGRDTRRLLDERVVWSARSARADWCAGENAYLVVNVWAPEAGSLPGAEALVWADARGGGVAIRNHCPTARRFHVEVFIGSQPARSDNVRVDVRVEPVPGTSLTAYRYSSPERDREIRQAAAQTARAEAEAARAEEQRIADDRARVEAGGYMQCTFRITATTGSDFDVVCDGVEIKRATRRPASGRVEGFAMQGFRFSACAPQALVINEFRGGAPHDRYYLLRSPFPDSPHVGRVYGLPGQTVALTLRCDPVANRLWDVNTAPAPPRHLRSSDIWQRRSGAAPQPSQR